MSLSSLALDPAWRDYWGMYYPYVEPWLAPLGASKCLAPRIVLIPSLDQTTIPGGGKLNYNFHLPPGSLIWGMCPTIQDLTFQLTDVGLGHQLFQEPVLSSQLRTRGVFEGRYPSAFLLPCPWPVSGEGLFTLEAWGAAGSQFFMVLLTAEVTDCPVR